MGNHVHGGDIYRHKNVLDFSSNCNPFGTPESVKRAVCGAADTLNHYPDVMCSRLREEIAKVHKVSAENIFCGNGAAEVIFCIASFLKPKKALIPVPAFAEYEQALLAAGCKPNFFVLDEKNGFRPDESFIESIDETIDAVFVCNPNNPTGVLLEKDYLLRLAEKCRRCHTFLIIDECFLDFIEMPEVYTMTDMLEEYHDILILKAFTKLYAMAGVRLGYGISKDESVILGMKEKVQPWNVSTMAQYGGIAALKESDYVRESLYKIKKERKRLLTAIKEIGFKIYESSANYIFFKGEEHLWEKCLAEGILIRDCSNYRGLGGGYYRVAVRKREENDRLIEVLRKIKE